MCSVDDRSDRRGHDYRIHTWDRRESLANLIPCSRLLDDDPMYLSNARCTLFEFHFELRP